MGVNPSQAKTLCLFHHWVDFIRQKFSLWNAVQKMSVTGTVPCHISSHSHNPCFYQKWVKNGWFLVDVEIFIYLCHILLQSPRLWRTQDIGLIRKLIKGTVPVISLWSSLPNLLLPRHISVSAAPSAWLPHDEKPPLSVPSFQWRCLLSALSGSITLYTMASKHPNSSVLSTSKRPNLIFFETFTAYCLIIWGKIVPLHRFTHAEPTSQDVGAATGREHYILRMRRWRFVFGYSKLPQSNWLSKTLQR